MTREKKRRLGLVLSLPLLCFVVAFDIAKLPVVVLIAIPFLSLLSAIIYLREDKWDLDRETVVFLIFMGTVIWAETVNVRLPYIHYVLFT